MLVQNPKPDPQNCDRPRLKKCDQFGFWQCATCSGYYYSEGGKVTGPMTRNAYLKKRADMGYPVECDGPSANGHLLCDLDIEGDEDIPKQQRVSA